ncbi:MAG: AraC family transcriptional regulator [Firmicutes bacterium]|nr:AraC family transcriptional regulator [Bacillota bacterium]HXL04135.1 AraC family transcriptional regulator [Bacillota bacterium]
MSKRHERERKMPDLVEVPEESRFQKVLRQFSKELPVDFNIHIINLLEVEWQPQCVIGNHAHDYWQVFYVISGATELLFDMDKRFFLKGHDLVLVEPGVFHEFRQSQGLTCRLFDVKFNFSAPPEVLPVFKESSGVIRDRYGLSNAISRILEEVAAERSGWEAEVMLSFMSFVIKVFRISAERQPESMNDRSDEMLKFFDPELQEIAQKTKRYIDTHYAEDLNREKIAGHVFVSPSYLSRIFQVCTGYSLIDYLTKVRIDQAKKLLHETQISVTEVSRQVGYKSPQYFSRVFKKREGIPPIEYRTNWIMYNMESE